MTVVKVIDASALAAAIFDEPEAMIVARLADGARLVAPMLLDFELANVCWKKCRQAPDRREDILSAYALRKTVPIEVEAVDHEAALALALDVGLTAYDASYLWLARKLNAELVTLDRALQLAAAR